MSRHARHGFTLLEVMVAMAILATSFVVLLENHGSSVRLSSRSREVSIAVNLAKDLMTDIELEGFPEIGTTAGDFEELYPGLYPGYRWEKEVVENNFWDYVRECYVRVFWQDGGYEQKIEITEYIAASTSEERGTVEEGDNDATSTGTEATPTTGGTATE